MADQKILKIHGQTLPYLKKILFLYIISTSLSNGVMAAQQILVLFVQVRILVGQQNPAKKAGFIFLYFSLVNQKKTVLLCRHKNKSCPMV